MNKPKFPNSKQVSIAIVLICISLIAGALIAQALTPSTTFWISPGVYPGAGTYTIWTEGSSYFAKDGYGSLLESSSDASEVIINTIGHITTSALIIIKVGLYSIDTEISLPNGIPIKIKGEVITSIYNLTLGTILQASDPINSFFKGIGQEANHCLINFEDLYFDGNGQKATYGIYLDDAGIGRTKLITNVIFDDCITGLYITHIVGGEIDTVYAVDCITGFMFYAANSTVCVNDLTVKGAVAEGCVYGLNLRGSVTGNIFYSLLSEGNILNELLLEGIDGGWGPIGNIFYGGWFEKTSVNASYHGVKLSTYGALTAYSGNSLNIFDNCYFGNNADFYIEAGRDNVIRGKIPGIITVDATDGWQYVSYNYVQGPRESTSTYTITDASKMLLLEIQPFIEHHVGSYTLTNIETGSIHTNLGAGVNVKLTLPQDAIKGITFEFVVMTAGQELQIDPGAAGALYVNGAKQADDAYIWADDEGESVKLVSDGNGDWIALYSQGTWTVV